MKDKPSEWIAISDLMSGVMAVVMLLLVATVLQQSISKYRYEQELTKAKTVKIDHLGEFSQSLDAKVRAAGLAELIVVDGQNHRLTLRDSVFERGSACLTKEALRAVEAIQPQIAEFLAKMSNARVLIEGHSDSLPVRQPVVDVKRFCTVYDDNLTLSAARAREARRGLIGALDETIASRIVVAGYGDSKPIVPGSPEDSRNRRVEVKFLLE